VFIEACAAIAFFRTFSTSLGRGASGTMELAFKPDDLPPRPWPQQRVRVLAYPVQRTRRISCSFTSSCPSHPPSSAPSSQTKTNPFMESSCYDATWLNDLILSSTWEELGKAFLRGSRDDRKSFVERDDPPHRDGLVRRRSPLRRDETGIGGPEIGV
jgi:hypothetical protein